MAPKKALDAGAGKLRNFWMFPKGSYTGVGKQRGDLKDGRAMCSDQIKVLGNPDLHVFDLNNDFHFFGPFDMVVCTGTADYFDDPADVLRRMGLLLTKGGTLVFEIKSERFQELNDVGLGELFSISEAVPFNCLGVPIAPEYVARELLGVSKKEFDNGILIEGHFGAIINHHCQEEMTTVAKGLSNSRQIYVTCRGRVDGYSP